jgi:hypothetical protein
MELFGEFGTAAAGVAALELPFLVWVWLRSRRRAYGSDIVVDAYRLGLRHRRKRARLWSWS